MLIAMRAISRFGPPLALMGLIFLLSAQSNLDSGPGALGFVIRKLGHMTEFGLLWFVWLRALGWRRPWGGGGDRGRLRRHRRVSPDADARARRHGARCVHRRRRCADRVAGIRRPSGEACAPPRRSGQLIAS